MGRQEMLLEVLPPLDWDKVGGETWGDVVNQVKKTGIGKTVKGLLGRDPIVTLRNLGWYISPDSPARLVARGCRIIMPLNTPNLFQTSKGVFKAGEFVVTAEVQPPMTVSTNKLCSNVTLIKPYVTAINFTDCPSATPRMSSWACSIDGDPEWRRTGHADRCS